MLRDSVQTGFRLLGAQSGSFESVILRLLRAPPWEESLANNITMARLRLGFWGTHGFYWPYSPKYNLLPQFHWVVWVGFALLVISALLDAIDGPVARRLDGRETAFGRFIDPLADKVIVWSAFSILLHLYGIDPWLVIPIIGIVLYDIDTSYRRARDNKKMQPNRFAKAKQWPLNVGVAVLLLGAVLGWNGESGFTVLDVPLQQFAARCGGLLLWAALLLAGASACVYHKREVLWVYYKNALIIQRMTALFF